MTHFREKRQTSGQTNNSDFLRLSIGRGSIKKDFSSLMAIIWWKNEE